MQALPSTMTKPASIETYVTMQALLHGKTRAAPPKSNGQAPVTASTVQLEVSNQPPPPSQRLFKALNHLNIQSENLIDNIIVHGSQGDGTQNGFSDLDATLVIAQDVIDSAARLSTLTRFVQTKLMPFLYSVDPLQHHGFFLLWPGLQAHYDEAILPAQIYQKAWALKPVQLDFSIERNSANGRTQALFKQILSTLSRRDKLSRYEYKNLISHVLILPSVYYSEQGRSGLKASSFAPFCEQFPAYQTIYQEASTIRNTWQQAHHMNTTAFSKLGTRALGTDYPKYRAALQPYIVLDSPQKARWTDSLKRLAKQI